MQTTQLKYYKKEPPSRKESLYFYFITNQNQPVFLTCLAILLTLLFIHNHIDMLAPTCICIIAPMYTQEEKSLVSH